MRMLVGYFQGVGVLAIVLVMIASGCARKTAEPVTPSPSEGPARVTMPAEEEQHEAVPEEYASLTSSVESGDEAIAAGKALYEEYCAPCHGAEGRGDGPHAIVLEHKPADFTDPHMAEEMTDAAFFWRISEGIPDEDMPPFKDKLSAEQRWQLVEYLRTFAPPAAEESAPEEPGEPGQGPSTEEEHGEHEH